MIRMDYAVLISIGYVCIGSAMVVWDFRNSLPWLRHTQKQDYLETPTFLPSLTIGTAVLFIVIWPYHLLFKKD